MVTRGERVTELMMLIEGGMRYRVPCKAGEGEVARSDPPLLLPGKGEGQSGARDR
jgi:hypothetical protein